MALSGAQISAKTRKLSTGALASTAATYATISNLLNPNFT